MDVVDSFLRKEVDKGKLSHTDYTMIKTNLHPTETFEELNHADFIIEVK
jgi:3-hydroxyacyl-CoA dehydrogenase